MFCAKLPKIGTGKHQKTLFGATGRTHANTMLQSRWPIRPWAGTEILVFLPPSSCDCRSTANPLAPNEITRTSILQMKTQVLQTFDSNAKEQQTNFLAKMKIPSEPAVPHNPIEGKINFPKQYPTKSYYCVYSFRQLPWSTKSVVCVCALPNRPTNIWSAYLAKKPLCWPVNGSLSALNC